jgi:hypothetical protein
MPKYIKNTSCDIEFLSTDGVWEYLEDELSNLPREIVKQETTSILFQCLREKLSLKAIKELTQNINWKSQPFELQAIAVGLKLYIR